MTTDLASRIAQLSHLRATNPLAIEDALKRRVPAPQTDARMMVIAADHPGRGALRAGSDPWALAPRAELLRRCVIALSRPGVTGFVGTADMIEDLALLGALDGKHVWGSMNRGGLAESQFEIDDRFTGYDVAGIVAAGLDGGKMLLRLDYDDEATADALERAAAAVRGLAKCQRSVMVEPFISKRVAGKIVNDLTPEAAIKAITIASALGSTSAWTILKLPLVDQLPKVMAATTLPTMILGGEVPNDPVATRRSWAEAMKLPNVFGLVAGRSLLFPPDGDVAAAVDAAVEVL